MNLKEYALKYDKPQLTWLDGNLLKLTENISDSTLITLSYAIFTKNMLAERFAARSETHNKHYWDSMIENSSSELAECLAKLEAA